MRVLVTGSGGYLGTVLVPLLRAGGHEVVGLDSGLFDACTLGADVGRAELEVDLRDVRPEHLSGVDAVVHLAALSNDPLGDLAPETTYDVNHAATTRLARLARDAGVQRFVYSSTCSVYGATGGDALVDEDAPLAPVTPYAVSKVRAEADLHALGTDAFTTVALRNATVHGLSPRLRVDIVVNDLVASAVLTGTVRVLSDGTPWRPLLHVEDVCSAFAAVLEAPQERVHGRSLNVCRPEENHRVSDVAELVAAAVPGTRVEITGERGGDPRSYRVDPSRFLEAVPAWKPTWTVATGAAQLAEAYVRLGLQEADARSRLVRLRWLAHLQQTGLVGPDLRWAGTARPEVPHA
ncbi:MAG: NAD-dependent epimerase/dehydratase [Frankiales bacterium]|nr:NAD-dependent epimerase/dehydratase [Frankiales bacterium]